MSSNDTTDISAGMLPRGIPLRQPSSLADSAKIAIPRFMRFIPATEIANGAAPPVQMAAPAEADQPAGIGHNSGAQPILEEDDGATSVARKKAYYIEVITDWFVNRRNLTSEYMTPKEIGACENRVALLLHAMAVGIASIYREELFNPQTTESAEERARGAFAMMGMYVLDTYFSNSDRGYSNASAERAGELLGCSVNTVKRARARLVEHRILVGGRKDGHGDRWWPAISRKLASDPKASVVWLLDATSAPIKRGRPTEIRTPDAGPRLDGEIRTPDAGPRFPEPGKSRPPLQKSSTPSAKSSTRMRGRETLDIRQDSLSGADAPGVGATLFPDEAPSEGAPPPSKGSPCKPFKADIDAALADYVETAKRCDLTVPRKPAAYLDAIAVRLREGSLDEWREMLAIVERSPHLRGENDRRWKADLGWLAERKNYAKVLDGRYLRDNPKDAAGTSAAPNDVNVEPGWWRDPIKQKFAVRHESDDWWRRLIATYCSDGWNQEFAGPPPGDPGCLVSDRTKLSDILGRFTPKKGTQ